MCVATKPENCLPSRCAAIIIIMPLFLQSARRAQGNDDGSLVKHAVREGWATKNEQTTRTTRKRNNDDDDDGGHR